MSTKYEDIEPYLIDYLKGEVDEGMEYRIKAYISQNPETQEELDELQATLDYMEETSLVEPTAQLKMDFYAMLQSHQVTEQTEIPNKLGWWDKLIQSLQSKVFLQGAFAGALMVVLILVSYFSFFQNPLAEQTSTTSQVYKEEAESSDDQTSTEEEATIKITEEKEAEEAVTKISEEKKAEKATDNTIAYTYKGEIEANEKPTHNFVPEGIETDEVEESEIVVHEEKRKESLKQSTHLQKYEKEIVDSPDSSIAFAKQKDLYTDDSKSPKIGNSNTGDDIDVFSNNAIAKKIQKNTKGKTRKKAGIDDGRDMGLVKNELLTENEPDERIQQVYASVDQDSANEQIITSLIQTLNTDPNPNVRIAAIDALEKFVDRQKVKYQIAKSLSNQNSPSVQMAAIDLIVKYNIQEGIIPLKKLLTNPDANNAVKKQAAIALKIIS